MMECYMKITCPCCCSNNYEMEAARNKSNEIEKGIRKEKEIMKKQVKLLLLGAGESGKTTFLKQMRILHDNGFNHQQLIEYKQIIYSNVIQGLKVLCDARYKLSIPFINRLNEQNSNIILSLPKLMQIDENLFRGLVTCINELWKDDGIKQVYQLKANLQLSESVAWFLDDLDRLASENYIPSQLDVLQSRSATKGVYELNIQINSIPFQFIDVGGQRSQRQKWLSCFESITGILFLVATSEFDQVLLEDRKTNRLRESMTIFSAIVNNRAFSNTSIILFLNKFDLLIEKITTTKISSYFPTFKGDDHSIDSVKNFLLQSFIQLERNDTSTATTTTTTTTPTITIEDNEQIQNKKIYSHFTIAINTENIRIIFNDVKNIILKKNLENLMLE